MGDALKKLLKCGCDRLPLCGHYATLLSFADGITHNRELSRKRYGLYTYRQWATLLKDNGIAV